MAKVCISDVVGTLEDAPLHVAGYHDDNYVDRFGFRDYEDDYYISMYATTEERRRREREREAYRRKKEREERARRRRRSHVSTPIYRTLKDLVESLVAEEQLALNFDPGYSDDVYSKIVKNLSKDNRFYSIGDIQQSVDNRGSWNQGGQNLLSQGQLVIGIVNSQVALAKKTEEIHREAIKKKQDEFRKQNMHQRQKPEVTSGAMQDFVVRNTNPYDGDAVLWWFLGVAIAFFLFIIIIALN